VTSTLQPRKSPRQARSTATVATILEAATRVLAKESLAGFNTNRVAEVAGVSVGSLYQYFPNKAALITSLIQRDQHEFALRIERCLDEGIGQPFLVALDALIDVALEHQFASPVFAAALDHEERRLPLDELLGPTQLRVIQSIQKLLNTHAAHFRVASAQHAAYDCLILVRAMVDANQHTDDVPALKLRVQRVVTGYLGYFEI
jgi:AcrR family transcriptional regulator